MPVPREEDTEDNGQPKTEKLPLPQTLVRIPTEHAPSLQQNTSGGAESGE